MNEQKTRSCHRLASEGGYTPLLSPNKTGLVEGERICKFFKITMVLTSSGFVPPTALERTFYSTWSVSSRPLLSRPCRVSYRACVLPSAHDDVARAKNFRRAR